MRLGTYLLWSGFGLALMTVSLTAYWGYTFQRELLQEKAPVVSVMTTITDAVPSKPCRSLPYAVIPCGIATDEDLDTAKKNDPVVAEFYKGWEGFGEAVEIPVKRAYIPYRYHNRVYWSRTKRRVRGHGILVGNPATGEITWARVGCGNRLSNHPQKPVLPAKQEAAIWAAINRAEQAVETPEQSLPLHSMPRSPRLPSTWPIFDEATWTPLPAPLGKTEMDVPNTRIQGSAAPVIFSGLGGIGFVAAGWVSGGVLPSPGGGEFIAVAPEVTTRALVGLGFVMILLRVLKPAKKGISCK